MTDIRLPSVKTLDHRIRTFVPRLYKHPIHEIPWLNIMLSGSLEYLLNDEPLILTEGHVSFFHMGDFVERREQQTDVQYISMRFFPGRYGFTSPPNNPFDWRKTTCIGKVTPELLL